MSDFIYCDNNATTAVDPRVLNAMIPFFSTQYGNASARIYPLGRAAYQVVEHNRKRIANFLNVNAEELYFTSGATEAINLAMRGVFEVYESRGKHILVSPTEHKAVLETALALEKRGAEIEYLPIDQNGIIILSELEKRIRKDTLLVCVMMVNNETGVRQTIEDIGKIVHQHKAFFLCDATQAPGKTMLNSISNHADLISFSAHKIYGPKGVGLLYVKRKNPRVMLAPQITGGGQERGIRAGTLNVPGIVGMATAITLIDSDDLNHLKVMRDHFESEILKTGLIKINAFQVPRAVNVSSITFQHYTSRELLLEIQDKIAVSTGSACSSENYEPSHVLKAMGLSDTEAISTLRFSFGRFNTVEEASLVADIVRNVISKEKA